VTIRTRLWLSVTALVGLVLLGNGLVVLAVETRELRRSLARESRTFVRLAGPQALRAFGETGLRESGDPRLNEQMSRIAEGLPSLRAFALLSARGRTLATYPEGADLPEVAVDALPPEGVERDIRMKGEGLLELVLPVHGREGSPAVWVQILVSDAPVRERLAALRSVYAGSLLVLLSLGALLASRLAGALVGPLGALKGAALAIRDGDLAARAPETGAAEIGDVARAFNAMAGEVDRHRRDLEERNQALERAYAELQALQQELVTLERMAAVGRTAAAVSHEIDNPIGVILGTAEMLREELSAHPALVEEVRLIEAECKRCRRIVRDLLDFARPSPLVEGEVDLPGLVSSVIRGLSHHPAFREIRLDVRPPPELPPLSGDADGIRQVALNLFLNAAKACDGKGAIEVDFEADERAVRLLVGDRGKGIPEGDMERIFEPFYSTGSGTGLGLSVSRRIVATHGGRLWAERREGGGSRFVAEFPRERQSPA
jgi:signal transduction histidine kinase